MNINDEKLAEIVDAVREYNLNSPPLRIGSEAEGRGRFIDALRYAFLKVLPHLMDNRETQP